MLSEEMTTVAKLLSRLSCDIEMGAVGESEVVEEVQTILGWARTAQGVACRGCGGVGEKSYSNTSTWRNRCGGAMITRDVCDQCWGTGRSDKTGTNLRELTIVKGG